METYKEMNDHEIISISEKLYDTINHIFFNDTLPQVTVKLENENLQYVGIAASDTESTLKRLDEIAKYGEPKTPIEYVLIITRAHIADDYLSTVIALASTILHEAVHFDCWDDMGHGTAFIQSATAHGLEVITDKNGNYISTRIKTDAAIKILKCANIIAHQDAAQGKKRGS